MRKSRALLLEQIDLIKEGQFEDWIIPAIVTDFKKSVKQGQENNSSRVSSMRDSYLGFEEWSHAVRALDRMAEIDKQDIVKVANKYFNGTYVAGYRRDGEQDIPEIAKPPIDKIDIDASRQSAFSAEVMAMPFAEVEPAYLVPERDFTTRELVGGSKLYYARNPLNDLFEFSIAIDIGSLSENRLPVARELLDKSGTPSFTSEELKKEWYKLGTDFRMSVDDQETTISISGLGEKFRCVARLVVRADARPDHRRRHPRRASVHHHRSARRRAQGPPHHPRSSLPLPPLGRHGVLPPGIVQRGSSLSRAAKSLSTYSAACSPIARLSATPDRNPSRTYKPSSTGTTRCLSLQSSRRPIRFWNLPSPKKPRSTSLTRKWPKP